MITTFRGSVDPAYARPESRPSGAVTRSSGRPVTSAVSRKVALVPPPTARTVMGYVPAGVSCGILTSTSTSRDSPALTGTLVTCWASRVKFT